MSKKMEVYGDYQTRIEVCVDVDAEEVCDFIKDYADDEDLDKIEKALLKRQGVREPRTLLEEQEFEVAKALASQYSLKELNEMYKKVAV